MVLDLDKYISDLWAALIYFQSHPDRFRVIHIFVVYRSYRKLFNRVKQDTKTWKVHVAEKVLAWTPKPNELPREDCRWFKVPEWLNSPSIPPEQRQMMNTRKTGALGKELIEAEFSSATVGFWARLLGDLLLQLEDRVKMAEKNIKNNSDVQGFKGDLKQIAQLCHILHLFVNWDVRIVETLLTRTSLAKEFNLPVAVERRFTIFLGFRF